jgi:hypothetical protein
MKNVLIRATPESRLSVCATGSTPLWYQLLPGCDQAVAATCWWWIAASKHSRAE